MSGPIVRRYGFPNFEKIFGDRPLEHGVEEEEPSEPQGRGGEHRRSPSRRARTGEGVQNRRNRRSHD